MKDHKLVTISLNTQAKVKEFHEIVTHVENRINICMGKNSYNAKETNAFAWANLSEPITIIIVPDKHGNTDSIYELIKRFEVE